VITSLYVSTYMQCLSHIAAFNFNTVVTAVVRHKFINHNNLYSKITTKQYPNTPIVLNNFRLSSKCLTPWRIFSLYSTHYVRWIIVLLYIVILLRNILENTTIRWSYHKVKILYFKTEIHSIAFENVCQDWIIVANCDVKIKAQRTTTVQSTGIAAGRDTRQLRTRFVKNNIEYPFVDIHLCIRNDETFAV